ncbi:hypothetical protein FU454_08800 [Campylobacter jejuni]|nr:hypothetical protein [Campylobacter jejuni]ECP8719624.1 hypothetical protein [Campylobacter jejuni]ECP9441141.1 hypothetical protein [Campylobacter jejuni]EDP2965532.1 hypothetical protein [Campylobacter jejuni]HED7208663.1 hypothetical protein [Campylobacter jejuni]
MTIDEKDALLESYTALNNSFNQLLQKMEDLYSKKEQITEETFNALIAKGNEIQEKINDYAKEKESVFDGKVEAIENATTQGVKEIKDTTTQSIETIEQKAQENTQIFEKLMQNNLGAIYAHLFSIENVLMDKKIIKLTYKE